MAHDMARKTAALAIVRLHKGGWANLTLKTALEESKLGAQQKAFAAALFYGTAERIVTLDYLLAPYLKKPVDKLDVEVRAVLETGLYQKLYMQIPAHAAVSESVSLVRALKKSSAAGMVNAVLRRADDLPLQSATFDGECERVSVLYSVSPAVAKAVMNALPTDYEAFLQASFSRPALCLRVNTQKTTMQELAGLLAKENVKTWQGEVPNCLYAQMPGGVASSELFAKGYYHVQSEASQYACAALQVQQGHAALDLCAAPGGKTATLCQYLGGGHGMTSCDVRENRLPLIGETLARLGIEGAIVLKNDASVYNKALDGQDRVLCDVPCSGLGVLAAKPDLRYTLGENFAGLPALQGAILQQAAHYVKPAGCLVYSTCTIRPQENQEVVMNFLAQNKNFALGMPKAPPSGASLQSGMICFYPHISKNDGFFVATLERL